MAAIPADLGVADVVLMTNNPDKDAALRRLGVGVTRRAPLPPHLTVENLRYLSTKRDRMGRAFEPAVPV